ncbi:MAG TPA: YheC/YheD family protein [Bacillota bacterium]|nr:YheC/YheD family protein [Bacillota bacterium]
MNRVRLSILPGDELRARLPATVLARLGENSGVGVQLAAGGRTVSVHLAAGAPPARMLLTRPVAEVLSLPAGLRVRLRRAADGRIRLGPLVGILTFRSGRKPFGPHTPLVRAVARRANAAGVVAYAFRPDDIRWADGTVYGRYRQTGIWQRGRFPLPDVVYDRISCRAHEARPEVAQARSALKAQLPGRYFPPGFLGKLAVHSTLAGVAGLARHLPATAPFTPEAIVRMLGAYRQVYLKPDDGSRGRGILRLARLSGSGVHYRYAGGAGGRERSLADFLAGRGKVLADRPYLVQQGIAAATFGRRPFDVRVLLQRDGANRWRITRSYARVAGPGRVVANVSRGGTALGLARAVRKRSVRQSIRTVARRVPSALESALGEPLGELGVDLAVTRGGRVFILEVNAKPYRMTWGWGSGPTFRYPLAYARYLARLI